MKKKVIVTLSFTILSVIVFIYLLDLSLIIINNIEIMLNNPDLLKENIGLFATIISLLMYAKLRFVDTRLFSKLQKVYGKKKFIEALDTILELLKINAIS